MSPERHLFATVNGRVVRLMYSSSLHPVDVVWWWWHWTKGLFKSSTMIRTYLLPFSVMYSYPYPPLPPPYTLHSRILSSISSSHGIFIPDSFTKVFWWQCSLREAAINWRGGQDSFVQSDKGETPQVIQGWVVNCHNRNPSSHLLPSTCPPPPSFPGLEHRETVRKQTLCVEWNSFTFKKFPKLGSLRNCIDSIH